MKRMSNINAQATQHTSGNGGYVTLISVIVVGAVGVAAVTALLTWGLSASRSSFSFNQSAMAQGAADACAEEALQEIREAPSFTGSGSLSLAQASCTFSVADEGGQRRRILSQGTAGQAVRKVIVLVDVITPAIGVSSWKEVGDF